MNGYVALNPCRRARKGGTPGPRTEDASPGPDRAEPPYPHHIDPIPEVAGLRWYRQLGKLGVGASGLVIAAIDSRNGSRVAIKLLPRGKYVCKVYLMREIMHHGSFWHPHVIALREVFMTPRYLAIVMEFAAGGDLFKYLRDIAPEQRLAEDDARNLFQQLIVGLQYCHERASGDERRTWGLCSFSVLRMVGLSVGRGSKGRGTIVVMLAFG